MRLLNIVIIMLLLIPLVHAKSGKMSLLTVGGPDETKGGVADLFLEVKPGKGTIYIDSFPLTKLDTQISTRFANEVACDFLKKDCSKYDFFYTIRAKATIVGGPSAGAAITVLTISVLSDLELDENTILTGTINSGGLIGPVAGINKKIEAAIDNDFTKVLIPKWQSSLNISKIEEKKLDKKITIVKVKNLEEALYHLTGKDFSRVDQNVAVLKEYSNRMEEVAETLCQRSQDILLKINETNSSLYTIAENFLNRSEDAKIKNYYYARASYCFSANLRLRDIEFSNKSIEELQNLYNETKEDLKSVKESVYQKNLTTLSDLETYMVVKERLSEAEGHFDTITYENVSSSVLAYTKERLFSAVTWSKFFGLKGRKTELDENHLKNGCLKKIAEAEERINYAELYLPGFLGATKEIVEDAFENYNQGEFALCIFKASKAKAEANILLTALAIHEDEMENVLEEKFEAIKKVILEQEAKKIFPILGYSYFEYSRSLIDYDIVLSLTFAEYALELSKLDMYFPTKKRISINIDPAGIQTFLFGFVIGAALVLLITLRKRKKSRF
ncbi:MAG: hypothetical protein ISS25_00885 [Nanoarchaeota archaeon]|nr:hypothetical protein [DPANN group archaeon]MBL7116371.1 hypothetical protein [Nanoarchaeota archaeon]